MCTDREPTEPTEAGKARWHLGQATITRPARLVTDRFPSPQRRCAFYANWSWPRCSCSGTRFPLPAPPGKARARSPRYGPDRCTLEKSNIYSNTRHVREGGLRHQGRRELHCCDSADLACRKVTRWEGWAGVTPSPGQCQGCLLGSSAHLRHGPRPRRGCCDSEPVAGPRCGRGHVAGRCGAVQTGAERTEAWGETGDACEESRRRASSRAWHHERLPRA
jgi:hypothetical protein